MTQNAEHESIIDIITDAAKSLGAKVLIEPEWNCVGNIVYESGVSRFFRLSTLDLNTMGASEIARDKGYARFFLKEKGYPVTEGKSFFTKEWCQKVKAPDRGINDAWRYAKTIGLPVYVKPNSLSRGVGVARVTDKKEFYAAAHAAMKHDRVFLVEKEILGKDYRLVVLDGEVISAYERLPLSISGDGKSSIEQLIDQRMIDFEKRERKTNINIKDKRLIANLRRSSMTLQSVIPKGEIIKLLDNANLSSGGESIDVTSKVNQNFKDLAKRVSFDMGLRLLGLDLMIEGDISDKIIETTYKIIEINSAPGLDHYARMGEEQRNIVADLYRRVISSMERPGESGKMRIKA